MSEGIGTESVGSKSDLERAATRRTTTWHVLLILAVSGGYEWLFVHHGIAWLFDEGWPLYAAMRLHEGGVLYADTFFLFPPGHLIPAWIAYGLDPPGVVLARILYAGFNVGLCVSLYLLGRRLMRPEFALLAALLVAVAAPRAHFAHLLFGYRYLVFSVCALLAFAERLRSGDRRWMAVAGTVAGVALFFRLTPAFAVSCGIGLAVVSAHRDWRSWLRDWVAYGLGMALIVVPCLMWFAGSAGLESLWSQVVLRILPLQEMQSKPVPDLVLPTEWDRRMIYRWFVPVQFLAYPLLYAGYGLALAAAWGRALRARRDFAHALLLATVIWGAVFFLRTLGRSDEAHLASAVPPACLLVAHLLGRLYDVEWLRGGREAQSPIPRLAVIGAVLVAWIGLQGSDLYLRASERGVHPIRSIPGGVFIRDPGKAALLDRTLLSITRATASDDIVLDLSHAPLLYVLSHRSGPGHGDVVTPGVFADPEDERNFVARLEARPPALVLWPRRPFDRMPSRSLEATAPRLTAWVRAHYEARDEGESVVIMTRKE